MCDPATATMATVAIGASAYSSYQQQKSMNKANEYQAQIAETNAQINDMRAGDAERRGEVAAGEQRKFSAAQIGQTRANIGGSGVLVDQGSTQDVVEEAARIGELDALTIKANAAREAWGLRTQGVALRQEANMMRSQKMNPWKAAGTTALTSGSQLGASYAFSRAG